MNNTTPDPPPTFYPAYCFALSPTLHTWAKLTAADVHALTTRPGFEGSPQPPPLLSSPRSPTITHFLSGINNKASDTTEWIRR